MVRTLITGASGFTGRYLAAELAARGHEVHGLVHSAPREQVRGLSEVHQGDLADSGRVQAIVETIQPDHVVHLAAIAFVAHDDVEELYRSNIVGTRQLLQALSRLPKLPASVVVASSANVYGNAREGSLDESLPGAPANDYGVSKVAVEYLAKVYADRLPLIIVRPFNYTGLGQSSNFLIPKIVEHARDRRPVIELGNLDVSRDFSDVRMVVDSYSRLIGSPAAIGGTFNICSGVAVSLREIVELVQDISGHDLEVKVNPAFVRADEVRTLRGSAQRLENAIGQLRHIPLPGTLRWMIEG